MTLERWIECYRRAWETADADEIVDLFTLDASYRSSVFREPHVGSDAIRQYWLRGAGTQQEVAVRMGRPIVTDDRAAVERWTTMIDPDEGEITLPGCLLLALCRRWPLPGAVGVLAGPAGQTRSARRLGHIAANPAAFLPCPALPRWRQLLG